MHNHSDIKRETIKKATRLKTLHKKKTKMIPRFRQKLWKMPPNYTRRLGVSTSAHHYRPPHASAAPIRCVFGQIQIRWLHLPLIQIEAAWQQSQRGPPGKISHCSPSVHGLWPPQPRYLDNCCCAKVVLTRRMRKLLVVAAARLIWMLPFPCWTFGTTGPIAAQICKFV